MSKRGFRNIEKMDSWEIIEYLRLERGQHVITNGCRTCYKEVFDMEFSDEEWVDYLDFVDEMNEEDHFDRMAEYLEIWSDEIEDDDDDLDDAKGDPTPGVSLN